MLAGRDLETTAAAEAAAAGRPVAVAGEAGAGKTTLLRAVAHASGRRVLEGGALATLSWLEYLALTRAVGRELAGADPQGVATEVLSAVGEDGLLVLDDLQWAAPATLDVVTALAGLAPVAVGVRTGTLAAEDVLARLGTAGFELVELGPLGTDDAAAVTRTVRPELSAEQVASVVRLAGGNPLLLRELAAGGASSTNLRRAVQARLRTLDPVHRDEFAMLALAGRPLSPTLLEPGSAARLVAAGLVGRTTDGLLEVRHALLGETAVDDLAADRLRTLHDRLGRLLTDPGEAARHHHLAGNRGQAHALALQAAERARRPGERASHLGVAALNAVGADADELRLAAAEALEAAHDWEGVFAVLGEVHSEDPLLTARAALLRAKGAWSSGRVDELQPALQAGLAAADGFPDVETLLRIEACRLPIFVEGDFEAGATQALAALESAVARGTGVDRAEYFLGTALTCAGLPGGEEHLRRAIALARAEGQVSTELTAANNLISFHESSGPPGAAHELAREMSVRAAELGLGYWETSFEAQQLQLEFHAGAYAGLVPRLQRLAGLPIDARTRDSVLEVLCMALVDTGHAVEATRLATEAMEGAIGDDGGRTHFWWVLAEAALWGGEPRRALEHVDRFLAELPTGNPNYLFGRITRAWALTDLGQDPGPSVAAPDRTMLLAMPHELSALQLGFRGEHEAAAEEFRVAAAHWAPYHVRGELRCDWAAGELLRRGGRELEAVSSLTATEERAVEIGLRSLVGRVHRSLRACGSRRTAERSSGPAGLTGREGEVLDLVGNGLTNDQIAARLGVTRRTVVALISSASDKLGATNRNQAAVLASRRGDGA